MAGSANMRLNNSGEFNFNSSEHSVDEKKLPVITKWAGFPGNELRDRMDPQLSQVNRELKVGL